MALQEHINQSGKQAVIPVNAKTLISPPGVEAYAAIAILNQAYRCSNSGEASAHRPAHGRQPGARRLFSNP
jgi:hypothetical protein